MRVSKIRLAVIAAVLSLGGCAYGFDGYGGYGGVNVGYGYNDYGYGYNDYGYGYGYNPYSYGYGYGSPYGYSPYGWYDGFYYPGSGIYVYDSYRRRHTWNDTQRRYWQDRTSHWRDHSRTTGATSTAVQTYTPRENWSGFNRNRTRSSDTSRSSDDNGRSRSWGRSSSSSSTSSDTTTRSDRSWHGRHGSNNDQ